MWDAIKSVAGVVSAMLAIGAAALAAGRWIAGSADRIVPSTLAGAGLALAVFLLIGGIYVVVQVRRGAGPYAAESRDWALPLGLSLIALPLMLASDFVSTMVHGEYHDNEDFVIGAGALGLGIVVAMLGIGAVTVARERAEQPPRGRKLCPDCAEYPRAAANVCPHCGYRFQALSADA